MHRTSIPCSAHGIVCYRICLACAIGVVPTAGLAEDQAIRQDKDYAFSLYAGRLSDDNAGHTLLGRADFVDSNLVAAALGRTFKRAENRAWSLELEGNVAKHSGLDDYWEFNALVTGRWHRFPWSDKVATSVAFGVGPSYATGTSPGDVEAGEGSHKRLLAASMLELTLGPPRGDWAALLRIHHRSTAWGTFGDYAYGDKGESNALTAGIRIYF